MKGASKSSISPRVVRRNHLRHQVWVEPKAGLGRFFRSALNGPIKILAFISIAALDMNSISHAEPMPETYYFTTTPVSTLYSRVKSLQDAKDSFSAGDMGRECSAKFQKSLIGGYDSKKAEAELMDCQQKINSVAASHTSQDYGKAFTDCRLTGFQNCYQARISAISVQIESGTRGSAVIIGDNGKDYLLATSKHVVDSIKDKERADVIWNGKTISTFGIEDIWKSKVYDIALIRARSKEALPTPALALEKASLLGKNVTVAGFPTVGDLANKSGRLLRLSKGSIATQASPDSAPDGYALGYTAPSLGGMSGGGVFVTVSCKNMGLLIQSPVPMVVGIHGRAESSEAKGATGFNFAVPISVIKEYKDLNSYLISNKQRANFGCPDGAGSEIKTFLD